MNYTLRFYRDWVAPKSWTTFGVRVKQTDLQVRAHGDFAERTTRLVRRLRLDIETYAEAHTGFLEALGPWQEDPSAPEIVREMVRASRVYGVGPMAAVAGAVAEFVGRALLAESSEVIIENGGDVFLKVDRPARLMLYAGEESPFNRRLAIRIDAPGEARGVCTSSAKVGPSLSMGRTDAVMTVARSAVLADAAATALGNRIHAPADVPDTLRSEQSRGLLLGVLVAVDKTLGAYGEIQLEPA